LEFTDAGVWESRFLSGTYELNGENGFTFTDDSSGKTLFQADLSSQKSLVSFGRSSATGEDISLWSGVGVKVDPLVFYSEDFLNGTYFFQAVEIENFADTERTARLSAGRITFDGHGTWSGIGDLFHSNGTVEDSPVSCNYIVYPSGTFTIITNDTPEGDTWSGFVAADGREILLARTESLFAGAGIDVSVPTSVSEDAGTLIGAGAVTVTLPPAADLTVELTASDVSEVTVPSSVTIAQGHTSANFDVTIVDDEEVDGDRTTVITASAFGWASGSRALMVVDEDDTDDDGLSDAWELEYLYTLADGPSDDWDLDGFSNLREYLSITDPSWQWEIPPVEMDIDFDEDADGLDLTAFLEELNRTDCREGPPCYFDLDGDGDVDTTDLMFFAEDFGRTGSN
jgi:hypothetical protein